MMGHKICFYGEIWLITFKLSLLPFLSGALNTEQICTRTTAKLIQIMHIAQCASHLYDSKHKLPRFGENSPFG